MLKGLSKWWPTTKKDGPGAITMFVFLLLECGSSTRLWTKTKCDLLDIMVIRYHVVGARLFLWLPAMQASRALLFDGPNAMSVFVLLLAECGDAFDSIIHCSGRSVITWNWACLLAS